MSATRQNTSDGAPQGKPALNPLTADDYAALEHVLEHGAKIGDHIQRAHHIGLNVGAHAAQHERDQAIARRILAMFPKPPQHPLED